MLFGVGQKVRWESSNTKKEGEIIAIVPAGRTPSDVGHPRAGGGGLPRPHESYIVRGSALPNQSWGRPASRYVKGPTKTYWPVVSLLSLAD